MSTAIPISPHTVQRILDVLDGPASSAASDGSSVSGSARDLEAALRACTRERLVDFARQLELKGTAKLAKDALVERVREALVAAAPATGGADDARGGDPGRAKFDLGPDAGDAPMPGHIPWGYGADRVTAMAIDPRRLFVYWEVTDAAIEASRKALGRGGADAWLNLRVYDITGRLFDGTNAHSAFDEGVSRDDRQWFFEIGKPTSTACIELGLKSSEGFFVKIARSGRVDFPREAPAGEAAVEWLTVRTASGPAGAPVVGGAPLPDGVGGAFDGGALGGQSADDWQGWTDEAGFPVPGGAVHETETGWEWREVEAQALASESGALEWTGPVHRSEWQSGPLTFPVDVPTMLEQHETGEISMRFQDGVAHVVYGPWQVVIRGVSARAERRVLATWEFRRTVEVAGGSVREGEGDVGGRWEPVAPGASEWRFVPGGASERRWMGASELLARGGSEVYMVGASERRFRGASERLFTGASERRFRGASERLQRGASERRLGGASERTTAAGLGGASERQLQRQVPGPLGASESGGGARDAGYPTPESGS
jgi:hypothetical protein